MALIWQCCSQVKDALLVLLQHNLLEAFMPTEEELKRTAPRFFTCYEVSGLSRSTPMCVHSLMAPLALADEPGSRDPPAPLPPLHRPGGGGLRRGGECTRHLKTQINPGMC
jgi:hypothetical protein